MAHRNAQLAIWAVLVAMVSCTIANAGVRSERLQNDVLIYDELAMPGRGVGQLQLSERHAAFAGFNGVMTLQYSGLLPNESDPEIGGSRIYKVLNSQQFFEANKKKLHHDCGGPIHWVGIGDFRHPSMEGEIWVSFFDLDDYRAYDSSKPGVCSIFGYVLHKS